MTNQRGAPPPNYKRIILALALAFAFVGLVGWAAGWAEGAPGQGAVRMYWTVYLTLSPAIYDVEAQALDMDAIGRMCKALDPESYAHAEVSGSKLRVLCIVPEPESQLPEV